MDFYALILKMVCVVISLEWDSDLAAILLLVHLLLPTAKGKRQGKISAREAADRVIKFMKVCL